MDWQALRQDCFVCCFAKLSNSQWQQIFTNLTRTYVEKTAHSLGMPVFNLKIENICFSMIFNTVDHA